MILTAFEYQTYTKHVKEPSVIIVELSKSDLNAFLKNKRINYDYSEVSLEQRCDQEIRVFITPYACYARADTYISFFYVYYMHAIFSLSSSSSCIHVAVIRKGRKHFFSQNLCTQQQTTKLFTHCHTKALR